MVRSRSVLLLILAAAIALPARARADEPRPAHTIYGEVFGKGGLWGLGYDYRLAGGVGLLGRFGVGATGSYNLLDGQHVFSLSPYVSYALLERGRHAWFVQAGPHLAHVATPSPVPEWDGTSSTGVGGQLSSGWELRGDAGAGHAWMLRTFLVGTVGMGGFEPWFGADFGWSF